jgi:hypothetical protein
MSVSKDTVALLPRHSSLRETWMTGEHGSPARHRSRSVCIGVESQVLPESERLIITGALLELLDFRTQ